MNIRNLLTILAASIVLSGCSGGNGFSDLDQFMDETKAKPRGKQTNQKQSRFFKTEHATISCRRRIGDGRVIPLQKGGPSTIAGALGHCNKQRQSRF